MWHCWRRFLRKRHTRIRLEESGVLARVGWADAQQRRGAYGDGLIPLEDLAAGTVIVDMRAVTQVKLVTKYEVA
jgi:hypothetical protein